MQVTRALYYFWKNSFDAPRHPKRFCGDPRRLKQLIRSSNVNRKLLSVKKRQQQDPSFLTPPPAIIRLNGAKNPFAARKLRFSEDRGVENPIHDRNTLSTVRHTTCYGRTIQPHSSDRVDSILFSPSEMQSKRIQGNIAQAIYDSEALQGAAIKTQLTALYWIFKEIITGVDEALDDPKLSPRCEPWRPHLTVVAHELATNLSALSMHHVYIVFTLMHGILPELSVKDQVLLESMIFKQDGVHQQKSSELCLEISRLFAAIEYRMVQNGWKSLTFQQLERFIQARLPNCKRDHKVGIPKNIISVIYDEHTITSACKSECSIAEELSSISPHLCSSSLLDTFGSTSAPRVSHPNAASEPRLILSHSCLKTIYNELKLCLIQHEQASGMKVDTGCNAFQENHAHRTRTIAQRISSIMTSTYCAGFPRFLSHAEVNIIMTRLNIALKCSSTTKDAEISSSVFIDGEERSCLGAMNNISA